MRIFVMFRYRRQKAVSAPMQRLNIARRFGGISERRTQFRHGFVEAAIEVDERVGGPKLLTQLFPGYELARTLQQQREDLERLFLEFDSDAVLAELGGTKIRLINAKPQSFGRTLSGLHRTAHPEFNPTDTSPKKLAAA